MEIDVFSNGYLKFKVTLETQKQLSKTLKIRRVCNVIKNFHPVSRKISSKKEQFPKFY
jgi:hypothetical protein